MDTGVRSTEKYVGRWNIPGEGGPARQLSHESKNFKFDIKKLTFKILLRIFFLTV
jgi:hypothetical protein